LEGPAFKDWCLGFCAIFATQIRKNHPVAVLGQTGKAPKSFITDGLQAYAKSSTKVFGKKTNHVRHIH